MSEILKTKRKNKMKLSSFPSLCAVCGCDTWTTQPDESKVYCSLYCRRKALYPEQYRNCEICEDEFYVSKGKDRASERIDAVVQKTCSVKCGKKLQAVNYSKTPLNKKKVVRSYKNRNHRKTVTKLFEDEDHFCDVVERKILAASFDYTREAYKITQDKLRRCDFVISIKTRHQQNVKIAVECKIDQKTINMDCCLGQAIVSAAIHDATPCVCVPSDFHPDKDYTKACKKYGIILCNEINVIEKIKESL